MDKKTHNSRIDDEVAKKRYWKLFSLAQLFGNVLLAVAVFGMSNNTKTIITPPVVSTSFWVTNDTNVDPEYLRQMAHWFAGLIVTVSPETVDAQQKVALAYTNPNISKSLREQLHQDALRIKDSQLTQTLFIENIDVRPKRMQAAVYGHRDVYVGDVFSSKENVVYLIQFKFINGKIRVAKFIKTTKKDPFNAKGNSKTLANNTH